MKYSVINIACKGSYGVVYKIKDLHTNKIHALKKIKISSVLHHKYKLTKCENVACTHGDIKNGKFIPYTNRSKSNASLYI